VKSKLNKLIIVVSFLCLGLVSSLTFIKEVYCLEGTRYLEYLETFDIYIDLNEGDRLSGSFETYNSEFMVYLSISDAHLSHTLSSGHTRDSGFYIASETYSHLITIRNIDSPYHRSGTIKYSFEINKLIPGYHLIGVILAVISISVLLLISIKKRINASQKAFSLSYQRKCYNSL